ncbi:MAG: CsbD family protein [Thermoleophilia bacterium]|nr:CsbD family protein [Thermoleophilia bacterium]
MSDGTMDKIKGRAKEAAGAATNDDELRGEGRVDQGKGSVKNKIDDVADKAKDVVD